MELDVLATPALIGFVASNLVAALVTAALAAYVYRNFRDDPIGKAFVFLVATFTVWILGTAVELVTRTTLDPATYLVGTLVKFVGVTTAPVAFLIFTILYASKYEWVTRRVVALLLVVPAVTFPIIATTLRHGLFYDQFRRTSFGGVPLVYATEGAWWWTLAVYEYGLLIVGSGIVVYVGAKRWPYYRFETVSVVAGVVVSWALNLAYVLERWPNPAIDPTPIGFALTSVLFAVGIFSTRFMDIPLPGRIDVLNAIDDGILVVDDDGRVADANETARELFDADEVVGEPIGELLPSGVDRRPDDVPVVRELAVDGARRQFKQRTVTIGGESAGWVVVVLTDITEEMESQRLRTQRDALEAQNEQLERLNRIVSHDLHNELDLLSGLIRRGDSRQSMSSTGIVGESSPEYLERAERSVEQMVDLIETHRDLVQATTGMTADLNPVELRRVLSREVVNASTFSTDVRVEVDGEVPDVSVLADEMLSSVFRNLLGNAVEHNDTDSPAVAVSVNATETTVDVTVADNGPGIPPDLREEVFEEGYTAAKNGGTGFGLYLVDHLVDKYDGEVRITDSDRGGASVTITLNRP